MMAEKHTRYIVIFCLMTVAPVLSTEEADEGPKCKTLFTFGYGYRQFFHMSPSSLHQSNGDLVHMRFQVKARSDAHILLSSNPSPEEADPVYEIVLGAGKNSFSDIRRKRRAATKASAYTKDILSGTVMKGFWVRINREGLILVGNEGEDLPFMQWQDPDPLPIEYFSFCTWSGVAGKWLYDCDVKNEAAEGSVAVQPTLTATDKLRQALLTNYNVYNRPIVDNSQVIEIDVQIQVKHVDLDAKKSMMTVECVLTLEWLDQKMVWNPANFSNLSLLNLIHHEIWQPELVHFNAAGKNVSPWAKGKAGMRVTSDGKVRWSPRAMLQSRCQMNMQQWPWDTQMCNVQLGFWQQPNTTRLMLLDNGTRLELQRTGSEWVIERLTAESLIITLPRFLDSAVYSSDDSDGSDSDSETSKALTFTFKLRRANIGYIYVLVIPLIVMIVMSLACFWMDPLGQEKLATDCLLLILMCGFLLSLESTLPAPADHMPYLFRAYMSVLVVVACATITTVLITSLINTSHFRPPPRVVTSALSSSFATSFFCLSRPRAKRHDYGQLCETGERSDCLSLMSVGDSSVDQCWALVASFCDRLAFLAALVAYTAIFMN